MLHKGLLISEINIGFAEDHLKCAMKGCWIKTDDSQEDAMIVIYKNGKEISLVISAFSRQRSLLS